MEQNFPKEVDTYVVKRPAVCRAMQYTGPDCLPAVVDFIDQYDMLDSELVRLGDGGVIIPTGFWDKHTKERATVTAKQGDFIVIRPSRYSPDEAGFLSLVKVEIISEANFHETYQKEPR